MTGTLRLTMVLAAVLWTVSPALAQSDPGSRPDPVVEGAFGYAPFLDEGAIDHALLGASVRYYLSRRISVGPELAYMIGPGEDRDLMLTGNLMVDVLAPTPARPRRFTPFVVAGGGWFRHSDRFFSSTFVSNEGAFTAGVGVRGWITDRLYLAGDARLGWEPHMRLAASLGYRLGGR